MELSEKRAKQAKTSTFKLYLSTKDSNFLIYTKKFQQQKVHDGLSPLLKFDGTRMLIMTTIIKVMATFIPNDFKRDDYNKGVMTHFWAKND